MNLTANIAAICLSVALIGVASAHPTHGDEGHPAPRRITQPAPTPIPETYAEVVTAIGEQHTAAQSALASVRIADFQRACRRLSELAAAIPTKTADLSQDNQATAAATGTAIVERVTTAKVNAADGQLEAAKAVLDGISGDLEALSGLVE